jgi:hypothetical protein
MNELIIALVRLWLLGIHYIECWKFSNVSSNIGIAILRVNILSVVLDALIWISQWVLSRMWYQDWTKKRSEVLSNTRLHKPFDSTSIFCLIQSRLHLQYSVGCEIYMRASKTPQRNQLWRWQLQFLPKGCKNFDILCGLLPKAEVIH